MLQVGRQRLWLLIVVAVVSLHCQRAYQLTITWDPTRGPATRAFLTNSSSTDFDSGIILLILPDGENGKNLSWERMDFHDWTSGSRTRWFEIPDQAHSIRVRVEPLMRQGIIFDFGNKYPYQGVYRGEVDLSRLGGTAALRYVRGF